MRALPCCARQTSCAGYTLDGSKLCLNASSPDIAAASGSCQEDKEVSTHRSGCATCNGTVCAACWDGYFLADNGTCVQVSHGLRKTKGQAVLLGLFNGKWVVG